MKRCSLMIVLMLILVNRSAITAQFINDRSDAQFLYPQFANAQVLMGNGERHTLLMNYNTLSELLVYKKNDQYYDFLNTDMADTIYLSNSKFVSSSGGIYEVLLDDRIPFYLHYKGVLLPPGTPTAYGVNSQVSNSKLITSYQSSSGNYNLNLPKDYKVQVDLIYSFWRSDKMLSFSNLRLLLNLFPEKDKELKQFIKQNKIKFYDPPSMRKLFKYINQLYI